MKKEVNVWAREAIKAIMLQEARKQKVTLNGGDIVQKFTHVGAAYAFDSSMAIQQKMYEVLYGYFRHCPGWAKDLEAQYMNFANIRYKMTEEGWEDKKGFIEALINEQYSELKRGVTDRAKQSHGRYIRLWEMPCQEGARHQSDDDGAEPNRDITRKKNPLLFDETFVRIKVKEAGPSGTETVVEQLGSRVISKEEWRELLDGRETILDLQGKLHDQCSDGALRGESGDRVLKEEEWQDWQQSQVTIAELRRICGHRDELNASKEQIVVLQNCLTELEDQ